MAANVWRFLVVFALLAGLVTAGAVAQSSRATACGGWCPPLIDDWHVSGRLMDKGNASQYAIELNYPGGESAPYKAIKPNDIIPAMWSQLILPAGVTLLRHRSYKSHLIVSDRLNHFRYRETTFEWLWVRGVPTWKAGRVAVGHRRVDFWITGPPGACFSATTRAMYRHNRRWVPIPGAPVQTTPQVCLPVSPGGTTTTTGP